MQLGFPMSSQLAKYFSLIYMTTEWGGCCILVFSLNISAAHHSCWIQTDDGTIHQKDRRKLLIRWWEVKTSPSFNNTSRLLGLCYTVDRAAKDLTPHKTPSLLFKEKGLKIKICSGIPVQIAQRLQIHCWGFPQKASQQGEQRNLLLLLPQERAPARHSPMPKALPGRMCSAGQSYPCAFPLQGSEAANADMRGNPTPTFTNRKAFN